MTDSAFEPLVLPRVGEARSDARDAAEKARARGYADGYAEGGRRARDELAGRRRDADERLALLEDAGRREVRSTLSALQSALSGLDAETARLAGLDASRIEDLAVELAAAILDAELSDAARSAAHALRRATEAASADTVLEVRMNARDLAVLRAAGSLPDAVDVVAAPEVDPGGAVVRVVNATVDARIAAALARARAALHPGDADGATA